MSHTRQAGDDPGRVLRLTLTVNALATAATGVLFLAGAPALHARFGLPSPAPLAVVGALFVLFGGYVWIARREPQNPRLAFSVFMMDVAYVAASVVFLLGFPRALSPLGWWLVLGLAEVVTVFAIAEYVGLRRLARPAAVHS
jgi:hypothetical protein